MSIEPKRLIKFVDRVFYRNLEDGLSAVNAAEETLFEVAKTMVNNYLNQYIVNKRLENLLIEEGTSKNNSLYKDIEEQLSLLSEELNGEEIDEISEAFSEIEDNLKAQ